MSPLVIPPWLTPMLLKIGGLNLPLYFTLYFKMGLAYRLLNAFITFPKTPSLQWYNCMCTLWTYSHLLQLYFPILVRQLFWFSTACQQIKKKILFYSQCGWYFCPNWSGSSVPEAGHSRDEVRQPRLYFKYSEGVFLSLTTRFLSTYRTEWND